jgi:hypothetical protein
MYGRLQNRSARTRLAVQVAVGHNNIGDDGRHDQRGYRHRPALMSANFKQRNDADHHHSGDAVSLQLSGTHLLHT